MEFDYSKLRGRVVEKCGDLQTFAKMMGLSNASVSRRFNNRGFFSQEDIDKACKILSISSRDIGSYFFTTQVQAN